MNSRSDGDRLVAAGRFLSCERDEFNFVRRKRRAALYACVNFVGAQRYPEREDLYENVRIVTIFGLHMFNTGYLDPASAK
jgi:hypothetical protein